MPGAVFTAPGIFVFATCYNSYVLWLFTDNIVSDVFHIFPSAFG
jgi:hypothetical protein